MEAIHILALEETPNIGPRTINKILSTYNKFEIKFEINGPSDIIKILEKTNANFKEVHVPDEKDASLGWDKANEIWKLSQENSIHIIPRDSPDYPKFLVHIPDPPALLHVLGNVEALHKDCIAIVGTREPTEYGISKAKKLGALFAKKGYTVVSGLAEGIDTAAHKGALESNGLTAAVLAHGLDTVYPGKNKELADDILKNKGALVSEYPWGAKVNRSYFVARDRIQSGLSLGVFVVETDIEGGTMNTVRFCGKQKRALIVLKHPPHLSSHPKTQGNIKLIEDKRADAVFETDNDFELVKSKMDEVKDNLTVHQDKKENKPKNSNQDKLSSWQE